MRNVVCECELCTEFQEKYNNILKTDRIIMKTHNFVVLPTVGCMVENYLLIIPKYHYTSFSQLSNSEIIELDEIIGKICFINRAYYKQNTLMFEHGSLDEGCNSGNSIVHAHLHILPFSYSLLHKMRIDNLKIISINGFEEIKSKAIGHSSYLYYRDLTGEQYVVFHSGVPSQYFRKLLAEHLGLHYEWNWREYPFLDNMQKTIQFYRLYSHEIVK